MKKHPLSVQLYSLREESKTDFPGVLKKVAAAGYAGVEFAGLYGLSPKQARSIIDDLGMKASSSHAGIPNQENLKAMVTTAQELGYEWHVCPFLGTENFATAESCMKTADMLQKGAQLLKKEGVRFAYHNHGWEFETRINGVAAFELVMQNAPDVYAQVDTYWCAVGGADVPGVLGRLGKKVALLHIKDGSMEHDKAMTAVGEGKMDWKGIIGAADENALEWLVVELDRCDTDMMTAIEKSARYLMDNGFGTGGRK